MNLLFLVHSSMQLRFYFYQFYSVTFLFEFLKQANKEL